MTWLAKFICSTKQDPFVLQSSIVPYHLWQHLQIFLWKYPTDLKKLYHVTNNVKKPFTEPFPGSGRSCCYRQHYYQRYREGFAEPFTHQMHCIGWQCQNNVKIQNAPLSPKTHKCRRRLLGCTCAHLVNRIDKIGWREFEKNMARVQPMLESSCQSEIIWGVLYHGFDDCSLPFP